MSATLEEEAHGNRISVFFSREERQDAYHVAAAPADAAERAPQSLAAAPRVTEFTSVSEPRRPAGAGNGRENVKRRRRDAGRRQRCSDVEAAGPRGVC